MSAERLDQSPCGDVRRAMRIVRPHCEAFVSLALLLSTAATSLGQSTERISLRPIGFTASAGAGMSGSKQVALLDGEIVGRASVFELGSDFGVRLSRAFGLELGLRLGTTLRSGEYQSRPFKTRSARLRIPVGLWVDLSPSWQLATGVVITHGQGTDEVFRLDRPGGKRWDLRVELRYALLDRVAVYTSWVQATSSRYPGSFVYDPATRALVGFRVGIWAPDATPLGL